MVKAAGPAKDDQSIYLGVYRQIINYNNHAAYELEGSDQLYIYFFSSVVRIDFGILSHKKVYGDIKHVPEYNFQHLTMQHLIFEIVIFFVVVVIYEM